MAKYSDGKTEVRVGDEVRCLRATDCHHLCGFAEYFVESIESLNVSHFIRLKGVPGNIPYPSAWFELVSRAPSQPKEQPAVKNGGITAICNRGPAMNDQAANHSLAAAASQYHAMQAELATLRAENKRLKAENLELLSDLAMLRKSDLVLAENAALRQQLKQHGDRLAAAERLLRASAVCITDNQSYWLNNLCLLDDINAALRLPAETAEAKGGE